MEYNRNQQKEAFIRALSNYSVCIKPYLRNIQDRYAAAYYIVEGEKVDLTAYCKPEFDEAIKQKELIQQASQ